MRQQKSRRDRARFRVGRVSVYLHHSAWWLYFRESDRLVRRRVAETREAAERIAAELNAQLSTVTSTMFTFAPMTIGALREEFLRYHEQVRRSAGPSVVGGDDSVIPDCDKTSGGLRRDIERRYPSSGPLHRGVSSQFNCSVIVPVNARTPSCRRNRC